MSERQTHPIGNPVDTWWGNTRDLVSPCLHLFAQFPPARNASMAREYLPKLRQAHDAVQSAPTPSQAYLARQHLLNSLVCMAESLKEQAVLGFQNNQTAHRAACRHYAAFTAALLRRGIYEPWPKLMHVHPQESKTGGATSPPVSNSIETIGFRRPSWQT